MAVGELSVVGRVPLTASQGTPPGEGTRPAMPGGLNLETSNWALLVVLE
jgi:hypothetical protein